LNSGLLRNEAGKSRVQPFSNNNTDSIHAASDIVGDAWAELKRSLYVQRHSIALEARVPDVSFEAAQRRSEVGRSLLSRLEALDVSALPHEFQLSKSGWLGVNVSFSRTPRRIPQLYSR
jgi:hypothetical protein